MAFLLGCLVGSVVGALGTAFLVWAIAEAEREQALHPWPT